MSGSLRTLDGLLNGYRPEDETEAGDLARLRAMLATGADPWARTTALHATVTSVILHPQTGRVLLRWHVRQQAWLLVGGHADPGEVDPLAIALREGREETGLSDLTPMVGAALVHLAVVPVRAGGSEPAHEHADLRCVLTTEQPAAAWPEHPPAALRWLSIPDAQTATSEPNVRRTLARVDRLLATRPTGATGW